MAAMAHFTADQLVLNDGAGATAASFVRTGLGSFLSAGAVLFASLVLGSAASLLVAGGNDLIAAILEGFLELGLWALGSFLAAVAVAFVATKRPG